MKKLDSDFVRQAFEKEGYILLDEYKNSRTKMNYICPNGHRHNIKWSSFKQGKRCPECAINNSKRTIEEVRQAFEKEGYILLDEEYIDSKTHMNYICSNGHHHSITWSNFNMGVRCPECSFNKKRKNIQDIKKEFENEGYKLLTEEYANNSQQLETICPEGHKHITTYRNFKKGNRCNKCYLDSIQYSYDQVKEGLEREGYILLSKEYINSNEKLQYQCPNGHIHEMTWHNFNKGKARCPECGKRYKGEEEIEKILIKYGITYKREYRINDCRDSKSLPFDFYIPSLNLCIEYDGQQHFKPSDWFGGENGFGETVLHDAMKNAYCEDNNINLLRIPYWEFNNIENIICQEIEKLKTFND